MNEEYLRGYLAARYDELEAQFADPSEAMGDLYEPRNPDAYAAGRAAERTADLDALVWPGTGPMILVGTLGTEAVLHRIA